eukprot:352498-Chlamydomonas_euryale.AAC.7
MPACLQPAQIHIFMCVSSTPGSNALLEASVSRSQSQGQEADIVIVSLTNPRLTRFLDKNRLNVLFSRARKSVILITDVGLTRSFSAKLKQTSKELALLHDMLAIGTTHHT